MGTPEFAVPSLEVLVNNGYKVVAVVTAPDKPQGRGMKVTASPVKESAMQHNIPVLQPVNLKSPVFLEELRSFHADVQVVVAFRMLPETVWSMPPKGTFNLHASLLPQYRGAAPINWAIINGEKETGVTTFFLQHEIDTGRIIFQEKEIILADDDAGTLYEKLMHRGAKLVLKTIQSIDTGNRPSVEQHHTGPLHHAPKIFKETCRINWNQPAESVRNFIRGLSPYPAAWAELNGKVFKVYRVTATGRTGNVSAGTIESDGKSYLHVMSEDQWLSVEDLQPEGKRRMGVKEYLAGNKI
ncbi:MAG: methionyl-tRNA formyltransferase [Bacteroidetes bacterium]|nr:methionyl-tRNA formyltransferase [Bacteroidota bacterium]